MKRALPALGFSGTLSRIMRGGLACGLVSLSLVTQAHPLCANALSHGVETLPRTEPLASNSVRFLTLATPLKNGATIDASQLLPQLDSSRRLVITISQGHTALIYDGHRIDSQGEPGLVMLSELSEHTGIGGDLAIVVSDLGEDTIARLDHLLLNFEAKAAYSCVAAVCGHLMQVAPELGARKTHFASTLVRDLIAAKDAGHSVEVISLNGESLESNLSSMHRQGRDQIVGTSLTGLALAVLGSVFWLVH